MGEVTEPVEELPRQEERLPEQNEDQEHPAGPEEHHTNMLGWTAMSNALSSVADWTTNNASIVVPAVLVVAIGGFFGCLYYSTANIASEKTGDNDKERKHRLREKTYLE